MADKEEKVGSSAEKTEPCEKECGEKEVKKEKKSKSDKKIAELEEKLKEENDKYLRMMAEYDNFRKRVQKEKESIYSDATSDAVTSLLPILDNLERALEAEPDKESSMYRGVEMIYKACRDAFEKMGVCEIEAMGKTFDPNFHNAVMHDENEEYGENEITAVFQKGYKKGDRVIRHSVVKVTN